MTDQLSLTFAALADPTRRAMLARLTEGPINVSELAEPFLDTMSLPAATKHVKVLERAGLLTKTREAQRRPCELNPDALRDVADWVEPYRAMWEESFDRLDAYLKTITDKSAKQSQPSKAAKGGKKDGRKK
ncbi:Transcriptional repressor SdpR [Botrimarina colliarenosi]|uniref:Transcriptional repressor SdpR n=1 Tax=Botrimarina colliarenosi TaxID=2528001 RepID=A0A5C6AC69_9BACT|nr:metalloregulator ArsR/SmtB family transcription factor [Botrimarina colliarenosi]TWT96735.1 Transcriptional repressor SdpR [Botrimarina colliarenosi]